MYEQAGVQVWLVTGLPPVQPVGDEVSTVRVWVSDVGSQAVHVE